MRGERLKRLSWLVTSSRPSSLRLPFRASLLLPSHVTAYRRLLCSKPKGYPPMCSS